MRSPKPPPPPIPQAATPAAAPIRPSQVAGMDASVYNPELIRNAFGASRTSPVVYSQGFLPPKDKQQTLGSGY